jgi:hypothetical protein
MARPRKTLPAGGLDKIRDLASSGVQETVLAKALGLDYRTWQRIRAEDPQAKAAYEEARALERDKLVGALYEKALKGDGPAAMFLLKTRHAYREQGPADGEQQGAQVNINLPASMTPEQWEKLVNVTPKSSGDRKQVEGASDG